MPSAGAEPAALLARAIGPPFFPVGILGLAGRHRIAELAAGVHARRGLRLEARWLPHGRTRALGFRVMGGRATVAYLPDHGPLELAPASPDALDPAALALCRDVDLLIHDAHFGPGEEAEARATGHATAGYAAALARAAGARRLLLTHHHPERADGQVEDLAVGLAVSGLAVEPAREGMSVTLG